MGQHEFKLSHGSATLERAMEAADRVEAVFGRIANADRRALNQLSVEDIALLIQFVRNAAAGQPCTSVG